MSLSLQARLVASWATRGPLAWLLSPLSLCYGLALRLRRALYRSGLLRIERLSVPVVVVGNLIAGGAGKTPTVMALLTLMRRRGWAPGVVSRGYGRSNRTIQEVARDTPPTLCGDEPLLLYLRTGVPVMVGRDRVAAGRELLRRHPEVNIVFSDDGLQHWRLARDVQVVVFDERGVGNGCLLPAGPLREALPTRLPARTMVIYNAQQPSTALPGFLARSRLAGANSLSAWWAGRPADPAVLASLVGCPLLAVAAIAQPQRFFAMLRAHGLNFDELALPDHYSYSDLPWPANTSDVVITEKDAVKLAPHTQIGSTRVWVVTLDLQIDMAAQDLLYQCLPQKSTRGSIQ